MAKLLKSESDREYMIRALKDSGAIRIYRRNSGAARLANSLAVEGLVTLEIVQEDEQSYPFDEKIRREAA